MYFPVFKDIPAILGRYELLNDVLCRMTTPDDHQTRIIQDLYSTIIVRSANPEEKVEGWHNLTILVRPNSEPVPDLVV